MVNIYLVGMMGSGKSASGRILARLMNLRYLETDQFIVKASGRTIPDIFQSLGEEEFRRIESEVLDEVSSWKDTVVSTGGGIVTRPRHIALMKETGIMVYLKAKPEALWNRISEEKSHRPLLQVKDPFRRIQDLLEERKSLYEKSDVTIETDTKTPGDVAREIRQFVEKKPAKR